MSVKKYLTLNGLTYFFNKIKTYLTSSTYLNSIGISNSDIDDIADDAGYSSGSLPASEDIFITGDIIPNTDNSVDLGASSKNIKMIYTKGITINGTQFLPSDYIPRSGGAVSGSLNFSSTWDYASSNQGWFPNTFYWYAGNVNLGFIGIYDDIRRQIVLNVLDHNGVMKSVLSAGIDESNNIIVISDNKKLATQEDTIPRSGGEVLTGSLLASPTTTTDSIGFGYGWGNGGTIYTYSPTGSTVGWQGAIRLEPLKTTSDFKTMQIYPSGTWTWNGTAVQITSDQRLKQQITEIDDKLLDAWGDVELVQFKYNESVDTKGDKARLHTGYVVQQIDKACKDHNVNISQYGLFCHEEYPEETEEVEVEQKDGTKTRELKVKRKADEHYSLRYTETLVVECAYLRKQIKELKERLEKLEGNSK